MAVVARKRAKGVVYFVVTSSGGAKHWERVGSDKREAERLDARRKKEVKAGSFVPERSGATTFGTFAAAWLDRRSVKAASTEAQQVRDYVLSREWLTSMRVEDLRPKHMLRLVDELKLAAPTSGRTPTLSRKTITNVMGVIRTMLRDAVIQELLAGNPAADLPRGTLSRKGQKRQPYELESVRQLLSEAKHPVRRVLASLALYTGMREGEICGRRWSDYDPDSAPLGALTCRTQYDGLPLKTDEPRRIPVHPELAALLAWWWAEGWELVYCRKPTASDWIVPPQRTPDHCYTRSGAYKAWRQLLDETGVPNLSLHSTRHTFTSLCRRGGARKDVLERITHNARGEMIDHYTHFDWAPLCEAVSCLPSLDQRLAARLTRNEDGQELRLRRQDSNHGEAAKLTAKAGGQETAKPPGAPRIRRGKRQTGAEVSAGYPVALHALALAAESLGVRAREAS